MLKAEQRKNQQQLDSALFKRLEELYRKIPKDPSLFAEPVAQNALLFKKQFQNLVSDTQRKNQRFGELVTFMARCSQYYTVSLNFLPNLIIDLLNNYASILHPYNRKKAVACILILRAKNLLFPVSTIQFLVKLFNVQDKELRKLLFKYILNDIRRMNKHSKNQKINQGIKSFFQNYIANHSDKAAQKCVRLMIQCYKRSIWTDTRAVNIIAQGCLNPSTKIRLLSAYFLLSTTQKLQEISDSQSQDEVDLRKKKGITKNTKNKQKALVREKKKAAKRLRKKQLTVQQTNYMPIDLIYSPQDFCEKVFNLLSKKEQKFSHKLIYMALVARMIWRHRLIILPFYSYLIKYMLPHQKQVAKVLAAFAEAVHEIIPDDDIETVIKHIVEKFVNDKCSQYAMTVGLNTIRQVGTKVPSIFTQELLLYLCTYYSYKNRNVSTATKSLINLVRSINPNLLQKKFRGKPGQFDQINDQAPVIYNGIAGSQLLPHNGSMPIYMDKILTDEDFKMIKKLRRKQEADALQRKIDEADGDKFQVQQSQNEEQEQEQQLEQIDEQDNDQEEQDENQQQIEQDDEQEVIDLEEEQEQEDQQEGDNISISSDEDDDQSQLDFDNIEQIDQLLIPKQKSDKKNKEQINEEDSDSQDQQSQQEENPHGFINLNQIAFYKKSKTQIKALKKSNKNPEQKFKHKPKEKKGGSTNRQKQKFKPLMMLRSKKNKIRNREKQVKIKIKDLKNKLGKMRSGKQAARKKNKKVKTS